MAQFDTGTDILQNVLRRAGEMLPTETATSAADHLIDAKSYINAAYWEVCALKPWRWARKRAQFRSTAAVTGSASVDDATVTMGAAQETSMAGRKFMFDADGIPHRIDSHAALTTTLTLQTNYSGTVTSGPFTIFDDEITVASDILAFPVVTSLQWGYELKPIPEAESYQRFPRNIFGTVRSVYYSFISDAEIRLVPWSQEAQLFECAYNYRPDPLDFAGGAADTPIVPRDNRMLIALRALEKIYADKRDSRLGVIKEEVAEMLSKMSSTETTFLKPRIYVPRGFRVSP